MNSLQGFVNKQRAVFKREILFLQRAKLTDTQARAEREINAESDFAVVILQIVQQPLLFGDGKNADLLFLDFDGNHREVGAAFCPDTLGERHKHFGNAKDILKCFRGEPWVLVQHLLNVFRFQKLDFNRTEIWDYVVFADVVVLVKGRRLALDFLSSQPLFGNFTDGYFIGFFVQRHRARDSCFQLFLDIKIAEPVNRAIAGFPIGF